LQIKDILADYRKGH